MSNRITLVIFAMACISCVGLAEQNSKSHKAKNSPSPIERGRYLVESVAQCGGCHTPRTADGKADSAKLMQGAEIEFKPVHAIKWEDYAPSIAGLPRGKWTPADVSKLLQTGLTPRGKHLDAPMPEYHMNAEDADAVVAYLASLPRPQRQQSSEQSQDGHQH
jgi:mono/diheme cytochrome c family protein